MESTALLVDISTVENTLPDASNCLLQFDAELIEFSHLFPIESKTSFNLVPDEKIMPFASIHTGITQEMVSTPGFGLSLEEGVEKIYSLLKAHVDCNGWLVGYNIPYDFGLINSHIVRILGKDPIEFNEEKIIDVLLLAKKSIHLKEICSYTMGNVLMHLYKDPLVIDATF